MFVDYGIDEGDDPFSEETWKKANPNYGISIEPETFRRTAKKAQNEGQGFWRRSITPQILWLLIQQIKSAYAPLSLVSTRDYCLPFFGLRQTPV
jgi:phage terminase large subunit-like protein